MPFQKFLKENAGRIQTSLSSIIKIILIILISYYLYSHLWRILFVNILLLILVFIPYLLKKYSIEIPREIEFVLLFFVVLSFLLGEIRGLVIQIFFGLAIGFIGFTLILILYKKSKLKPNVILVLLFTMSISISLGALSELSKYYLKIFLNYEIHYSDYQFAMESLSLVFIGSFIAAMLGIVYLKGPRIKLLDIIVRRFKKKNPNLFIERTDSPEELIELIKKGETEKVEFKSTLRTNLYTIECDKKIEQSVLKTLIAFLNTTGGTLLIGVTDQGNITGIERDNFHSNDRFNLHFTNLIKEHIGNQFLPYMHFEIIQVEEKHIMKIDCMKSKKPVFLRFAKEEEFFIRLGAATVQITGSKLIEYVNNNF